MDGRLKVQPINYLLKLQISVLVISVVIAFFWHGSNIAIAYFYGGIIVIANTLLQKWHLISAAKYAKSDAGMNLRIAYRSVAQRWVLTLTMFIVGFAFLISAPLALLAGFIVIQLTLLFGNLNRA